MVKFAEIGVGVSRLVAAAGHSLLASSMMGVRLLVSIMVQICVVETSAVSKSSGSLSGHGAVIAGSLSGSKS